MGSQRREWSEGNVTAVISHVGGWVNKAVSSKCRWGVRSRESSGDLADPFTAVGPGEEGGGEGVQRRWRTGAGAILYSVAVSCNGISWSLYSRGRRRVGGACTLSPNWKKEKCEGEGEGEGEVK